MAKASTGSRWKSAVCDTEVIVIKPAGAGAIPECGGVSMVPAAEPKPSGRALRPEFAGGSLLGKRYTDAPSGLELLCTKPGNGALGVEGRLLTIKDAKPLPASD